jgi:hypothetical protein
MTESPEFLTTQLKKLVYGTEKYATIRYQSKYKNAETL